MIALLWRKASGDFTQPTSSGKTVLKALPAPTAPAEKPTVTFPGLGEIEGTLRYDYTLRVEPPYVPISAEEYKPYKVLLDHDGKFLYLQGRLPQLDVIPGLQYYEKVIRKQLAEVLADFPTTGMKGAPDSFRILRVNPLDLSNKELKAHLYNKVMGGDGDIEIWSLSVMHPIQGYANVLMEARTSEYYKNKDGDIVYWNIATNRNIYLENVDDLDGFTDQLSVAELWRTPPARAEQSNLFGIYWEGEVISWDDYKALQIKLGKSEPILPPPGYPPDK
jgi:hypothetical protein